MRITHLVIGLGDGGAEKSLYKIVTSDQSNVHSVISLTSWGKYGPLLSQRGIFVDSIQWNPFQPISSLVRLSRALRMTKPEALHGWMPHGALAASVLRKLVGVRKVFWSIRSSDYGSGIGTISTRLIVRTLAWLSSSVPSKILVVGNQALERHAEMGFDIEKMVCVHNGYLAQSPNKWAQLEHEEETRSLPNDQRVTTFGMVARHHPKKGHKALLETFAGLKNAQFDWELILVGEGISENNDELVSYLARLNLSDRVTLMGPVDNPEDIYKSLDFHILPSLFGEGFPNVVAESMLAGVPNIVSDVGDSALIVGETGWVVPPGDRNALKRAIEQALESEPQERRNRGVRANERICREFSFERMLRSHLLEYNRRLIVAYPRYSRLGASSRVRMFQFHDGLASFGWEVSYFSFSNSHFLQSRYQGKKAWLNVLFSYFKRIVDIRKSNGADLVWIQRELIPLAPSWLELILRPKGLPIIYDFDDAVYEQFRESPQAIVRLLLRNKISRIASQSVGVVVGNRILADFFSKETGVRCAVIPSVIDTSKLYPARKMLRDNTGPFVFGWIGTPLTFDKYVREMLDEFESVAEKLNGEFWIVGAESRSLATERVKFFPWSEETEFMLLNSIDVGVMPLQDDSWSRGKCGYKLLQYMAVGKPVVASAVGVNVEIVEHGKNGFLVQDKDDWERYLTLLAEDRVRASEMGIRAAENVELSYSLEGSAAELSAFFLEAVDTRPCAHTPSKKTYKTEVK